jgi:hypothetical protein
MTTQRKLVWGVVAVVVVAAALYAELVRETAHSTPSQLLACMDVDYPWTAWACKQVLLHDSLTPAQVAELNGEAGARLPIQLKDPAEAEQMLTLFLSRGVDIDAGAKSFKDRTALHSAAVAGSVGEVTLLLKHGARADVRDADGQTALDLARLIAQQHPGEPNRAEVVRLLEDARPKQAMK